MNDLILASAGAGKTRMLAKRALKKTSLGQRILILTYTENNQKEILNKICSLSGYKPSNIIIKGWFTFLLEDLIRPYQRCIFKDRIPGIYFNSSDPHKKNGRTIKGRAEKLYNGTFNSLFYLTKFEGKAHTTYLSKLAMSICKETKNKPLQRLSEIYNAIFIDEVQDLVGWDFDIINSIAKLSTIKFICVGDFRQTIYSTHYSAVKKPKTKIEKLEAFKKFGFNYKHMNISWRCVQPICDFADLIHADEEFYQVTISKVLEVPDEFAEHQGIFAVSQQNVSDYIDTFNPVILRVKRSIHAEFCKGLKTFNFGNSKGLGFSRILIIPTEKHKNFLSGKLNVFESDKTEKAKNMFYVAVTRAHYSVAFLYDGNKIISGVKRWSPE